MLFNSIKRAVKRYKEKGWDKLYIAVDLHGVVLESTYTDEVKIIPEALASLKKLALSPHICLIAFTSTALYLDEPWHTLAVNGLMFDYVNRNPEVKSNEISYYYDKFHFDLLLDDKAGFNICDWYLLNTYLEEIL